MPPGEPGTWVRRDVLPDARRDREVARTLSVGAVAVSARDRGG